MAARMKFFPVVSLRRINNFVAAVAVLLALYIVAAPYLPQFAWWLRHDAPVVGAHISQGSGQAAAATPQPVVHGDKLFIPRMDLAETIYGGSEDNLNKGVWHVADTSTPDQGGNTVLVGHRFTYKDPTGVFYHLDKVQHNDVITMHWQGKAYEYKVTEIKVVPASEISIEDNTQESQLTIYTCTPLRSVANRLVIIAKPLPSGAGR